MLSTMGHAAVVPQPMLKGVSACMVRFLSHGVEPIPATERHLSNIRTNDRHAPCRQRFSKTKLADTLNVKFREARPRDSAVLSLLPHSCM